MDVVKCSECNDFRCSSNPKIPPNTTSAHNHWDCTLLKKMKKEKKSMSYFDDQVYKAKRDTADELSNIRRLLYMKECRDAGVIDEDEWERFLMSATEKIRSKK